MEELLRNAIESAIGSSKDRKFTESLEIAFTIKDVDLKNPANRIQEEVRLPAGRGRSVKIAMFAGGEMATKAQAAGLEIIDPTTIEDLGGNRQKARKLANKMDFFLSEIPHMGTVGRYLGIVLGPRGKMPRPVPPKPRPWDDGCWPQRHDHCEVKRSNDFPRSIRYQRPDIRGTNEERVSSLEQSHR